MFAFFKSRLKVIFRGIMRAENVKSEWREIIWKKVFQVETTKLRGFLFAFTTSEGSEKKSRQSCRHFNCIYSYFNFNASTSRSIALKKQVSIILLHQAFAASRASNVSCQRAKFHIKKILFHRVIKRRRRQQRDAE